jgi:HPt (histidine-containing phosphotransfer) domain-containing protein
MTQDNGAPASRSKLKEVLGGRFVERTQNEMSVMRTYWAAAREGDVIAIEQLLQFVHRIGGAAAMLGFPEIGDPVRHIERIVRAGVLSAGDWRDIDEHMIQLEHALTEAEESLTT